MLVKPSFTLDVCQISRHTHRLVVWNLGVAVAGEASSTPRNRSRRCRMEQFLGEGFGFKEAAERCPDVKCCQPHTPRHLRVFIARHLRVSCAPTITNSISQPPTSPLCASARSVGGQNFPLPPAILDELVALTPGAGPRSTNCGNAPDRIGASATPLLRFSRLPVVPRWPQTTLTR